MTRAERIAKWTALADETANLVRDYRAATIVDADHAIPTMPIRIAAVRGQVNVMTAKACPVPSAWEAAADFLPLARLFTDDASPTALRLQLVDKVACEAERLIKALADGERSRADVFG